MYTIFTVTYTLNNNGEPINLFDNRNLSKIPEIIIRIEKIIDMIIGDVSRELDDVIGCLLKGDTSLTCCSFCIFNCDENLFLNTARNIIHELNESNVVVYYQTYTIKFIDIVNENEILDVKYSGE